MLDNDGLRSEIEELLPRGVEADVVDQLMNLILENHARRNNPPILTSNGNETFLRQQIQAEPDWKKKAALSALLISHSLE